MLKRLATMVLLGLGWASAFAAVEVNTATAQELTQVKGIGEATAERIVLERANQPYSDWSDFVKRVKGVGDKQAQSLSEGGLTVEGASYGHSDAGARPPSP